MVLGPEAVELGLVVAPKVSVLVEEAEEWVAAAGPLEAGAAEASTQEVFVAEEAVRAGASVC
jgi:hypothetical protein